MLRAAFLSFCLLLAGWSLAQHEGHEGADAPDLADHSGKEKAEFNAGELIMGHIADEHGWHIAGDFSFPLPVIIYDTQRGLHVFSSARFEHGHAAYDGYMLHDGGIVAVDANGQVDEAATANIWDISITKNVASIFLIMVIMLLVFTSVARTYAKRAGKAPKGLQSLLEPLIIFVRDDVAKSAIGPKYMRFMPYLLTIFFVIFLANITGLIPIFPFGANLTGNIAITFTLAVFTFIVVTLNGNKNYWQHIFAMPGVPKWVLIILTPVEVLGVFLKPFVLMIRLFANMAAGHIIALSFFSLIFVFGATSAAVGYGVSVVSLAFTIFMTILDVLISFIQAYVFTFLSALYIGAALEEHHEHKESIV
ncbi:MAG: F0F1 ATP synthase subunit A [Bacteroidetes bacterium]|nr:F0F1 ATP synthase subunit A [Bacteroidota bacterium]